jgi:hypothetical protein
VLLFVVIVVVVIGLADGIDVWAKADGGRQEEGDGGGDGVQEDFNAAFQEKVVNDRGVTGVFQLQGVRWGNMDPVGLVGGGGLDLEGGGGDLATLGEQGVCEYGRDVRAQEVVGFNRGRVVIGAGPGDGGFGKGRFYEAGDVVDVEAVWAIGADAA